MRPNALKRRLLNGETAVALMMLSGDPHVPGISAEAGFDSVMPDLEHTSLSHRELETLVRASDAAGIVPTVRVAGSSKRDILSVLETGVRGIMVPAVESAEEAAAIVAACRYHPEGRRGMYYLGYSSDYGSASPEEHLASANRELLTILQIETVEGVRHAAEIAAVEGVDCVLVGPGDLSQSLGIPFHFDDPAVWHAIRLVIAAAKDAGKIPGIMPVSPEYAARSVEEGLRFLLWGPDLNLMRNAARADVALLSKLTGWQPAH